jgi:hypothetical protein
MVGMGFPLWRSFNQVMACENAGESKYLTGFLRELAWVFDTYQRGATLGDSIAKLFVHTAERSGDWLRQNSECVLREYWHRSCNIFRIGHHYAVLEKHRPQRSSVRSGFGNLYNMIQAGGDMTYMI